jgi:uroporphyrinogen-III synthase
LINMGALSGVGVLVTRPEPQALPLCRLLEELGAIAVRFPAIVIAPCGDAGEFVREIGPLTDFDLIVFTSANAVRFGHSLLDGLGDRTPSLAAIGPATARALTTLGYPVPATPQGVFDSESLLRHPLLTNLEGRRVLLVKGQQGRELLSAEIERRGARLVSVDVYRRERAAHDAAELAALEARVAAHELQLITATSAEIAAALLAAATPRLRDEFDRLHWLVPGARVAAALRALAVTAPILEARSAEDHDLVEAVVRFTTSGSRA